MNASASARDIELESLEGRSLFAAADPVLLWNAVALDAVANDYAVGVDPEQKGPTGTARALAIVHAAIYDAANAFDRAFEPYLVNVKAPSKASLAAAVAQAAYDTLVALYPRQSEMFDDALDDALDDVPDGKPEDRGRALGHFVAAGCLESREGDHSDDAMNYDEDVVPGVFQTFPGEPDALHPQWGHVTPFTMTAGDQFRAPPPPSMLSDRYTTAFNEVKDYGGNDGDTLRTDEQTEIGIYWGYDGAPGLGTPPRLYNQIARVVAIQEGNSVIQNARLFAMLNLTMADAGIASWDTKYAYDFWRPIRGIRMLDADGNSMDDGNPDTDADADWTPLGAPCTNCPPGSINFTPPFPAYTSGHATFGGAAFQTLINFYGRDDIPFTFVSDEFNGVNKDVDGSIRPLKPRSFDSFSQAMEENGQSRIYLGVHWAFDKTEGIKQGKAIADQAFDRVLEPIKRRGDDNHDHHHSCSNDRFIAWRGTHQRDNDDRSWRGHDNAGDDDDDLVASSRGNHG